MKSYQIIAVIILHFIAAAGQALAQTYEEEMGPRTSDTIRSACHGFNTEHLSEEQRKEYYEKLSGLCRPNEESPVEYEFPSRPERDKTPHKWVERESDADIEVPCEGEFLCIRIRKRYKNTASPVTQTGYDRVKAHCQEEYWCIEEWFRTWPRELPPNQRPQKAQGLSIDDLMGGEEPNPKSLPSPTTQTSGPTIDDLMDDSYAAESSTLSLDAAVSQQKSGAYAPQTSMDNIFEARDQIKTDQARNTLNEKLTQIYAKCRCVPTQGGCFKGPSFNESSVNNSLRKVEKQLNSQKSKLCYDWKNTVDAGIPNDMTRLSQYNARADQGLSILEKMDEQFDKSVGLHRSENRRIANAREAQSSSSGFQWGKLAALGVGAAIGGIGDLDTETQFDLVSGMIQDSMEGVEGTSNFQGSANARLSQLANEFKAETTVASSSVNNQQTSSVNSVQSLTLACNNDKKQTCMEITYPNQSDYENAKIKCQSYGDSNVVASCRHTSHCVTKTGAKIALRYDYDMSERSKKLNCESGGGSFVN